MAVAPELTVAPHDEYLKSSRVRSFSTASESSSEATPSLTSDEFRRLHIEQGLSMDLGSERDHVADIFGCIGSPSPDYEDDNHDRSHHDTSRISNDGECPISDTFWSCDPSVGVTIQMGGAGAAAETPLTIFDMFHRTLATNGDNIALSVKRAGKWIKWTYSQYYQSCINVAKAFIKLGLEQYHGVCILGFNSPEWHISNMAAIMAGGIPVGLYLTNTAEACCYIADSNKANIIVVDNDSQLQKIMQIRPRLTHLKAVIFYGKIFTNKEEGIIDWKELAGITQTKDTAIDEILKHRMSSAAPNKCATLIYTSGTSGNSKGVMLSHDNITWMCERIFRETKADPNGSERIISYLPLSHVAPQLLDIYFTLRSGGSCWFAQPDALKGSLLQTLREVHPTIFLGVPRVWDKVAESMQLVARNITGVKAKISHWAKGVGLKGNLNRQLGGHGTPLGWSLANMIFFKKVRKSLGLDKCHFPMTGSAPISQETLTYFMSVNIPIYELYGMSESTGPTSVTNKDFIRFQSSGHAVDGTEMMINDPDEDGNGEVYIRGRHLFMGYIGEPRITRDVITDDGWLKTGDIGYISHDGYLYITGRAKELIILTSSEKIAPVPIESSIKNEFALISNVVLVGDGKRYLCCLITLKVEFDEVSGQPTDRLNPLALSVCAGLGSTSTTVKHITDGDRIILNTIQRAIDKVNKRATCSRHKIVKWSILDKDFSIVTGELTHTMKLKRRSIAVKYADIIDSLYSDY